MEGKFISNNQKEHQNIVEHSKKWYKKWWVILLLSFLSLLLIFLIASIFFIITQVRIYQEQGFFGENSLQTRIYPLKEIQGQNSNFFGASKPKITIVEFSDFACPNSRNFYEKTKKIRFKYYNDLKIIRRDFPVISDYSEDLALAARCAGEQGLYWKAHDALYDNFGISTKAEIYSLMLEIGAEPDRLSSCLENNKYIPQIAKDLDDGINLGIRGTPTWFINGYRADGDMPENMLNDIIENILKN